MAVPSQFCREKWDLEKGWHNAALLRYGRLRRCAGFGRASPFASAIETEPPQETEKYILRLRYRDKDGRDEITPLVVLRERQAVDLIKAKDKSLKAIHLCRDPTRSD